MLVLENVSKGFGRKKPVLKNISIRFESGVYGLLGPNGSGKTTLLRCLTKIYPVSGGTIRFQGEDIARSRSYLSRVGYLPQEFGLFPELTIMDAMRLFANLKGVPRSKADAMISDCLSIVNLYESRDQKGGTLSGGMVRRVGIAQALINNPPILVFDEPTAGLDPEERMRFKNSISQIREGRLILLSTHIVDDVEAVCDSIAVMREGRFAAYGSCQEIRQIAQNKVYSVPEEKRTEINGRYHIQKNFEVEGVPMIRILCEKQQNALTEEPTIEDGYLCALKKI